MPSAICLHLATLLGGLVILSWANRDQWFTFDEWDFLALRGLRPMQLLNPHSEHWSTLPIVVYRLLYAVAGLHSYWPYVLTVVAVHLACAHLLFRVSLRAGVEPRPAALLVGVFVVLGAGAENLLWAFQIGFVGSVAFGMAALLAAEAGCGRRGGVTTWLLCAAALMCSGIGVTMVAVTGVTVLLRHGVRRAAVAVVPPAVLYLVWLAGPGHNGLATHETTIGGLLRVPSFVLTGLTAALDRTIGIPRSGVIVLVAVAVHLARRRQVLATRHALAAACAAGSVCTLTIAGIGRASAGVAAAEAPRYSYIAVALLLPAIGLMVSEWAPRVRGSSLVVAAGLAAIGVHNVALLDHAARRQAGDEDGSRRQILAAADLVRAGAPLVDVRPDPKWAPNLYLDAFRTMVHGGKVPRSSGLFQTDRLAASTALQVALLAAPPPSPQLPGPVAVDGAAVSRSPGCADVSAAATGADASVKVDRPGWISVRSQSGGPMAVSLSDAGGGAGGPARDFELLRAKTMWLAVSRPSSQAMIHLPAGTTELCTGGP